VIFLKQFPKLYRTSTWNQSCKLALFWSPNPADPDIILEARFRPKKQFTESVKICATAGYQKT